MSENREPRGKGDVCILSDRESEQEWIERQREREGGRELE